MLDPRAHIFELERILLIRALRIAHRDAGLSNTLDTFDNQRLVAVMKRLITPDEQRSGLLWIEHRPQMQHGLLGPVLRCALRRDAQIIMLRRHEHLVRVLERPLLDAVDPDQEWLAAG